MGERKNDKLKMEYEFTLQNGRRFESNDVKCPICRKTMDIAEGDMTIPRSEFVFRNSTSPFTGTYIDRENYTDITMKCPEGCCELKFTDCNLLYCVGNLNS